MGYTRYFRELNYLEKELTESIIKISNSLSNNELTDFCQIYKLSLLDGYTTKNINELINSDNNILGSFSDLLNNWEIFNNQYNDITKREGLPEFIVAYNKILYFLYPFIAKQYKNFNYIWINQKWTLK